MKDAKSIAKLANDISIAEYVPPVPYPYTLKHAEKWINHALKKQDGYDLGITLKETDELIGGIGIHKLGESNKYKVGEIGYWLGKKYRRKGYTKEAATLLIDYMFNKFGLRRIYAPVYSHNLASQMLLESLGFKKEGTLREHNQQRFGNKWLDEVYYGLLKREWKS